MQPDRLRSQDGVHGDADDLGRQGVEHHGQACAQQRRGKMPPAGAQILPDERQLLPPGQLSGGFHESADTSFLFLLSLFRYDFRAQKKRPPMRTLPQPQ